MKKAYLLIMISNLIFLTSCWNYIDVNKMRFVAGVAFDYDETRDEYIVTSEVVKLLEGGEKFGSALFQSRGKTIFDAVRDMIMKNARRLYWGHAKVVILGRDMAGEKLLTALDYTSRDAEFRDDMWILVSGEKTANEIFENTYKKREDIASFHIDDELKNEKSISTYHGVPTWRFIKATYNKSTAPTLPIVKLVNKGGEKVPGVGGQAIFKEGKIVGTLNEMETRAYLWVIDKLKGGVMTVKTEINGDAVEVVMELFGNKTKMKAKKVEGKIVMEINIKSEYGIAEVATEVNVIEKKAREVLKKSIEKEIKRQVKDVIEKVQKEYESDIFGFGSKIKDEMPEEWRSIESDWNEVFSNLETEINVVVNIRGSALTSEPIKVVGK